MEETRREIPPAIISNVSKKTQAIIRKLNAENRGISKNSKSSNGSKRGAPSNLASNRSMSFVSRKAFGDITSNILMDINIENMNNSINHNRAPVDENSNLLSRKQLQNQNEETRSSIFKNPQSEPCSNISTQIQTTQQVDKSMSSSTSSIIPSKRALRSR